MTKLEELATAMAVIMTDNGLPVSSPYDGNLDDVGHERWRVMVECARVVVSGLYEPTIDMLDEGHRAAMAVRKGGLSGMTIIAQTLAECARENAAWRAMVTAIINEHDETYDVTKSLGK